MNSKGAFWYCTYEGGLTAELFVALLKKMMRRRVTPVHLVVDGLPAHKTALVKDYVASTKGLLTLHFLPGYAPELNPDELVWSHMKRTGVARAPLRKGDRLSDKVAEQLASIKRMPQLVRSFFKAPTVAYINDCRVRCQCPCALRGDDGLRSLLHLNEMPGSDATGDWLRRMGAKESGGLARASCGKEPSQKRRDPGRGILAFLITQQHAADGGAVPKRRKTPTPNAEAVHREARQVLGLATR